MGDLDSALIQLQKTIEMDPNFIQTYFYLGKVYLQKGMYEEALTAFNKAGNRAYAGISYAKMGNVEEARRLLEELLAKSKESYLSYKPVMLLYFALGDYDQGFAYLEKAFEKHNYFMKFIRNDFKDDEKIRSDPRFKEILRKMNLDF